MLRGYTSLDQCNLQDTLLMKLNGIKLPNNIFQVSNVSMNQIQKEIKDFEND